MTGWLIGCQLTVAAYVAGAVAYLTRRRRRWAWDERDAAEFIAALRAES